MATADYWSSADLKGVAFGGLIREDVLEAITQIDNFPFPFTDMIGQDSARQSYHEWTQDSYAPQNLDNKHVDGVDASGNDAKGGKRVGNQCQISTKQVTVTSRADASDTIGRARETVYQNMKRGVELKRDMEGIFLSQQASVADDGDAVPGQLGALGAWLETNTFRGATGADGGFDSGVVDAPTAGTKRGLTEVLFRDCLEAVWLQGGNPTIAMSVPSVIRKFSEYSFDATARIATLTSDVKEKTTAAIATASVNVWATDYGVTVRLVPNRLMPNIDPAGDNDAANFYMLDPGLIRKSVLRPMQSEQLAKVGLSEKWQQSVDYTLTVLDEAGLGVIADIDFTVDVTTVAP